MNVPSKKEIEAIMSSWPGKRGIDVPEHIFDAIAPVAHGISQQVWGRHASPEQLQWLSDNGHHEPEQVHQAFGNLPHPHAPSLRVDEYQEFSHALQVYRDHGGKG